MLRMCNTSGPVWEVRRTIGNRIARVSFALEKAEMVPLHGFIKKTQQNKPADIELALKRALAEQLDYAMHAGKLTKIAMAQRMATSRSQLDRVQGPANLSAQLDTLIKAANAVGKTVEIKLKRQFKPRSQTA
jgi:antitoxin HicB